MQYKSLQSRDFISTSQGNRNLNLTQKLKITKPRKIDRLKVLLNQSQISDALTAYSKQIISNYDKFYQQSSPNKTKISSLQSSSTGRFLINKQLKSNYKERRKLNLLQLQLKKRKAQLKKLQQIQRQQRQSFEKKQLKNQVIKLEIQNKRLKDQVERVYWNNKTYKKMKIDRYRNLVQTQKNCSKISKIIHYLNTRIDFQTNSIQTSNSMIRNINSKIDQNQQKNENQIIQFQDKIQQDLQRFQHIQGFRVIMKKQADKRIQMEKIWNQDEALQAEQQRSRREKSKRVIDQKKKIEQKFYSQKLQKLQKLKRAIKIANSEDVLNFLRFAEQRRQKMLYINCNLEVQIQEFKMKISKAREQMVGGLLACQQKKELTFEELQQQYQIEIQNQKELIKQKQKKTYVIDQLCTYVSRLKHLINPNTVINLSVQNLNRQLTEVNQKLIPLSRNFQKREQKLIIPRLQIEVQNLKIQSSRQSDQYASHRSETQQMHSTDRLICKKSKQVYELQLRKISQKKGLIYK